MTQTNLIANRLAEFLEPDIPGFSYTRSRTQLRKKGKTYSDDLIINVTTRNGVSYDIAFYVGVVHSEVEELVAHIEERKVSPYDRTIFQYSPNVGKQETLPYDGSVWWWGLSADVDLERVGREIRHFVMKFALTYHSHFHDIRTIRDSLENRDGLSLNLHPFKQVLAIDYLLSDKEHIACYLNLLQGEINSGYHHDINQFNGYYERLARMNGELFPVFNLMPKKSA